MRSIIVRLHRYAGLALAAFLTIAGFTGSLLAFYHELDEWLNPDLFHTASESVPIDPLQLVAKLERQDPRLTVVYLPLRTEPNHSRVVRVAPRRDAATGKLPELGFDEIFVDPATGQILGKRLWGACCLERKHLLPFLYAVHYSLYLPGNWGVWLMGIIGLVWVFDCFFGFYLTLPARFKEHPRTAANKHLNVTKTFWQRWKISWRIKRTGSRYRFNFDLHRAGGLWFWFLLLVMAVSSISFNLHDEVFEPVVEIFSPLTPSPFDVREEHSPEQPIEARVSFREILNAALREAESFGWQDSANGIFYDPLYGVFGVGFGLDHASGLGNRWLYFDGLTGLPTGAHRPGEGTAGDVFAQLQYPMHSGQIAGLPGRIMISITGLMVCILSVTGIVIWAKK